MKMIYPQRIVQLLSPLLLLFLLIGCVPNSELASLRMDLSRLERQIQQIQKDLKTAENRPSEVLQRTTSDLTRAIDRTRQNQADLLTNIEELQRMVRTLGEQMTTYDARFSQLSAKLDSLQAEVLQRLDALRTRSAPAFGEKNPAGEAEKQTSSLVAINPQDMYEVAYNDYLKGRFDLAIEGFRDYLAQYPNSERADDAQYWLAESYYSKRAFPSAIEAFQQIKRLYPQSLKVPSSLLKTGYAYYEMGKTDQGKQELQRLVQQFPFSAEAKLAEQKLQEGKGG